MDVLLSAIGEDYTSKDSLGEELIIPRNNPILRNAEQFVVNIPSCALIHLHWYFTGGKTRFKSSSGSFHVQDKCCLYNNPLLLVPAIRDVPRGQVGPTCHHTILNESTYFLREIAYLCLVH